VKVNFWLLDINYEVKNHEPEIWLWGVDDHENRILIIDKNFTPYFYVIPKENENPETVIKEIKKQKANHPYIIKLEVVERKFFGKPLKTIRVECKDPNLISDYAKNIKKIQGVKECLEDDIRYTMQYLIDASVSPCGWHSVEAEETPNTQGVQVEKIYVAKSSPKPIVEKHHPPALRILSFSFMCYSEKGSAEPDRNPVIIISVVTNTNEERNFIAKDNDDKVILEEFLEYVKHFNPDVIVGYETNRNGWTYLIERCHHHGLKLTVDRVNAEPHTSVYGHVSITGRANLDIYDFADEFTEVKIKSLQNIADYLGVMNLKTRTFIEQTDIPSYWKNHEKRSLLIKFSMENSLSILKIVNVILDFALQLSNLVGLPLDHVGTAAVGFRVEWFLIWNAHRIGELVPKRVERPYIPYAGAIVLAPKSGIHEDIAVLDFKAMYPNLMITYNISPDTYLTEEEAKNMAQFYIAPEVKHKFRKEPPGFYKKALSHLIKVREELKLKLEKLKPEDHEYRILDARQKAIKVITNATYGYAGWVGARWYIKPVAEAATAWGRQTISETIKLAEKTGLEVIYGDTDSLFIKYEKEKIEKFAKEVNSVIGLEIKPDKIYTRILFTEAKKRYAGLLSDGRLDIVGLEVVRGDWAEVAKNVQEKVLEIILKEKSPQKAVKFTRQLISDLRQRKISFKDLVIWKTLTKNIDEYAVKAPHVEAAKYLRKEGWALSVGDKVGYVVTVGTGKLYQKVKPYIFASYEEIDIEYYVANQILPAALRILEMFGVKEEDLLAPVSRALSDFIQQ
jgi:DNA polymerase I